VNRTDEEKVLASALRSLGRRPHSVYELKIKLLRKGMDDEAVNSVLNRLCEDKYLDDLDFAKRFVEYGLIKKLWGQMKVRAELQRRGVVREIVDELLANPDVIEKEILGARRFIEKKYSFINQNGEDFDKQLKNEIISKLKRRGYSWDIIGEVVRDI
jgi:regulatory protein